ncbi:MAG: aminotransferase class IV [Chitinophagaceae bacterium]
MHICFDGELIPAGQPVLAPDNKSYRYGDGLFETMKMVNGRIPLFSRHIQRLFGGLERLQFSIPSLLTPEKIQQEIISLCEKNKCSELARIRLSVSRGEGGIYEQGNDQLHYLIECSPANSAVNEWNEKGLVTGIYPDARKSADSFSGLKSANYLPYTMAARYAMQRQWNDCLVLNTVGFLADATIANIFIVKNNQLITPAANQGGVDGVMRKYLLEALSKAGYAVKETTLSIEEAMEADELFLTNALYGIRWVDRLAEKKYTQQLSLQIYQELVQTIWR